MRAVILSALPGASSIPPLASVLEGELARAGYETARSFDLTSTKLAFCQGEFDCWVKTPGVCRSRDAETEIVAAVRDADALVFLGPVTFGGHGHVLKRAIDRLLCLLSPFFEKRHSLTHHALRYEKQPDLFAVGWAPGVADDVATTFDELNDANAINYLSPRRGSVVLDPACAGDWGSALRAMLASPKVPGESIVAREPLRQALLAAAAPEDANRELEGSPALAVLPDAPASPARKVALLVGSPKKKGTSASEVLARALIDRFTRASVPTELHFATEFVHDDERAKERARSIRACELFLLATPLYVDALPSLTTHALELIARAPRESSAPARFVTLVNCGFPEAEQNRTALRMARHFAAEAGYVWAGGLPLGGGGAIPPDRELAPAGPVAHVVRALDLAVPALTQGGVVPLASIEAMVEAPMPDVLYRLLGDLGWRWQAHRNGLAQRELGARPLDEAP